LVRNLRPKDFAAAGRRSRLHLGSDFAEHRAMNGFSKSAFVQRDEPGRSVLCGELSAVLLERLKNEPDFHQGIDKLVAELRSVGHDLWIPPGQGLS
jgi:hypothetical protein